MDDMVTQNKTTLPEAPSPNAFSAAAHSLPKLAMRRPSLHHLPDLQVPHPYRIRTYQPGDESAWAAIMNTGIGENWTAESVRAFLINQPQFGPQNLFFALYNGHPVGTACAWLKSPDENITGYLHMVCVLPAHRGHKLGYFLSLRVLCRFREMGLSDAILVTDDFRIPAIRQYLRMGFAPEISHPSHQARWSEIFRELSISKQVDLESGVE